MLLRGIAVDRNSRPVWEGELRLRMWLQRAFSDLPHFAKTKRYPWLSAATHRPPGVQEMAPR